MLSQAASGSPAPNSDVRDVSITSMAGITTRIPLPGSTPLAELLDKACSDLHLPADCTMLLLNGKPLKTGGSLDSAGIVNGSTLTAVATQLPVVRCHHRHYGRLNVKDIKFDTEKSLGEQWKTLAMAFGLHPSETAVYLVPSENAPDGSEIPLFGRYAKPVGEYADKLANEIAGDYDIVIHDNAG